MGCLFLVILMITSLCLFASSTPLHYHKPFLSDSTSDPLHQHGIRSTGDDSNERSIIVRGRKFAHGSAHGGAHGREATGAGEAAKGGGGDEQGSAAVVPVVVAGAATNHHPNNHHNAGSHHANCIMLPTLIATALFALIVH